MGFNSKIPGPTTEMRPVNMDFSYGSAFGEDLPDAYERLLLDAMLGDSTLYMRKDEVDSAWRFITEILRGWQSTGQPAFRLTAQEARARRRRRAPRLARAALEETVSALLDPRAIEQEIARIREKESNPYSSGTKTNLFTLLIFRSEDAPCRRRAGSRRVRPSSSCWGSGPRASSPSRGRVPRRRRSG